MRNAPKAAVAQVPQAARCTNNNKKRLQHKPYQLLDVQNGASEATCSFVSALLISAFVLNVQKIAYMLGPGGRGVRVQLKCDCMVEP